MCLKPIRDITLYDPQFVVMSLGVIYVRLMNVYKVARDTGSILLWKLSNLKYIFLTFIEKYLMSYNIGHAHDKIKFTLKLGRALSARAQFIFSFIGHTHRYILFTICVRKAGSRRQEERTIKIILWCNKILVLY